MERKSLRAQVVEQNPLPRQLNPVTGTPNNGPAAE